MIKTRARLATVADAAGIATCVAAAYQHYIQLIGKPPGPMLDNYADIIRSHTVYVIDREYIDYAHSDNHYQSHGLEKNRVGAENSVEPQIVGLLVLIESAELEPSSGLLLDNIAVHPQFQGLGYGRELMALAESISRTRGYATIHLYTHELMAENIDLYASLGYVEAERRTEKGYQRVYMQKSV